MVEAAVRQRVAAAGLQRWPWLPIAGLLPSAAVAKLRQVLLAVGRRRIAVPLLRPDGAGGLLLRLFAKVAAAGDLLCVVVVLKRCAHVGAAVRAHV